MDFRRGFTRRRLLRLGVTAGAASAGVALLAACVEEKIVETEKIVEVPVDRIVTVEKEVPVEVVREVIVVKEVERVVKAEPELMTTELGFLRPEDGPIKRGGVLRTAWNVATQHFDLHQNQGTGAKSVMTNMYNNLVRKNPLDGLLTIIPELASGWEFSADNKQVVFSLREGVKFHDGVEFTSADVVATFSRIINPPAGVVPVDKAAFAPLQSVEALDKHTVAFNLSRPYPLLFEVLAMPHMVVYSANYLEAHNYDAKAELAPGTGVWKFTEHQPGERWLFQPFEDYWDPELPYVGALEMLHVGSGPDRGTAVLAGQADMTFNTSPEIALLSQERDDIGWAQVGLGSGAGGWWMNALKPPFDDPLVRRACHLCMNRPRQVETYSQAESVYGGVRWAVPRGTPGALTAEEVTALPGYMVDKTADIAEAKSLLTKAGFANGIRDLEIITPNIPQIQELQAPIFQDSLASIGIEATIRPMERAAVFEEITKREFDFLYAVWTMEVLDPWLPWATYYHSQSGQNYASYVNLELDALIDELGVTVDQDRRVELILAIQDKLDEDPPVVSNGMGALHNVVWNKKVKGLALEKRTFREWSRLSSAWLDD